mgnify:FL=1
MKDFQVLAFCSNAIVSTCAACSGEKVDDMYLSDNQLADIPRNQSNRNHDLIT